MNTENVQEEGLSLGDIFHILKLHWIVILIVTALGAIGGFAMAKSTPTKYEAQINVYIYNDDSSHGTSTSQEIIDSLRLINTFISFINEKSVGELTAEKLNATENFENVNYYHVLSGLTAVADENTLCVNVSYVHTNATVAKIILETVILSAQEIAAQMDNKLFEGRISIAYSSDELGSGNCASVYSISRGTVLYLAIGTIIGAVLSIAYALIRELMDNTIRDKKYIEDVLKLNVIGTIPEIVEERKNEKK